MKGIEKGEPVPGKEIVPPFLSIFSNFLSLMKEGVDPAADDEGTAFMKALKKLFLKLSKVSLGDIRTRKELVDIRLFFLKLFNEALSVASRKLNPNDFFLPIIGGVRELLPLISRSIKGEGE